MRYLCGGNPHNIDDCIDLTRTKEKPEQVVLELTTEKGITELCLINFLIGNYRWVFPSRTVEFQTQYGGCIDIESQGRQKVSVDNANRRLEDHLKRLEELGINVQGREKRFDYSATYK